MGLVIACAAVGGLLLVFCLVQVVTGDEIVKLTRHRRSAAQVRREYAALSVMSAGIILIAVPGISTWWGLAMTWLGLIVFYAVRR